MTDLVIRKIAWEFDATVPFMWQPKNPSYHDPADQPLPEWADTWMREYERGTDMTTFAGSARWAAERSPHC